MMSRRRAAARHDTKEAEVRRRLEAIGERFSFHASYLKDFKKEVNHKLYDRSIEYLNKRRVEDEDHFYMDMNKPNYLTMLYIWASDRSNALKQNNEILLKDPENFRAIWCQAVLQLKGKRYEEVDEALSKLERISEDEFIMLTAKAEVALNYPDFGPAFYQKSVELLEAVLTQLESDPELLEKLPRPLLIKWKYDLAHTYDKLMNKGNISTYWTGQRPSHKELFIKVKKLLQEVIDSMDSFYVPKAWVDLADAFKKYEETANRKQMETLPLGMNTDTCFSKALEVGPDDPYVLERCGRQYKQRATCVTEFLKAIQLLEKCTKIDSSRDIAYHHMGLAYRSIWIEKEKHTEAWLHKNRTKRYGEKKTMQNCNPQNQHRPIQHVGNRSGTSGRSSDRQEIYHRKPGNQSSNRMDKPEVSLPRGVKMAAIGLCAVAPRSGNKLEEDNLREVNLDRQTSRETIPPKFLKMETEVPKQYNRRPDYHDQRRASNPVAKDLQHLDLMSARSCFQKASDIRKGTCGKYLIDLARTYVSTQNLDKARELLELADKTTMNDNDGAYLFEQWGLLDQQMGSNIESTKNFYRTSLKCSAEACERSKIAFNKLKDILDKQMKENPSEILEKEQLLLRTTIQDGRKAIDLLKRMTSDRALVLMWELVEMFYNRNRPEDAKAAFTYLEILAKANKLGDTDGQKSDNEIKQILYKRASQLIEITQRNITQVDSMKDNKSTLSSAYKWLILLSNKDISEHPDVKEKMKVRLFAPSSGSPELDNVKEVLVNVMGIEVFEEFFEGSSDLTPGRIIGEEILNGAKGSECAVVVMQSCGKQEVENRMLHSLKIIINNPLYKPKRICRAVSDKCTKIEDDLLTTLREWKLHVAEESSNLDLNTTLAISLLRALFLD